MADKPITREEKYLAYLTGDYTGELPKPITRKEKYLYELCLKGIGGEVSPEEIKNAVNEYLEKNPVKPGATTEQAQQIEQNKTDVASLKEETGSLKEDLNSKFIKSINLFDKNSEKLQKGVYISQEGAIINDKNCVISGYITLKKGIYTTGIESEYYGASANQIATFSSNGTFNGNLTGVIKNNILTFEVPEKTIIRLKLLIKTYQTNMLVEGEQYPDKFIPYTDEIMLADNVYISKNNVKGILSDEYVLYGKKIAVNGDSICYGNGYIGGYAKIIADKNNMSIQNIAEGGGTITAETYMSDGRARHWICRTIANLDSDSDYIIIEGGVNDEDVEIGNITNGYNESLIDTTFCGALESICKQLTIKFAGKKYGFIITHKMNANFVNGSDRYDKCIKILEKWGVPYINLQNSCPAFGYFTKNSDKDLYRLTQKYTTNADGWHPTEECYRIYYVPKIEAWMKSL